MTQPSVLSAPRLLLLFPLAVVEGPIVTVIAAYLASLGYLEVPKVYFVVVLADLVGDTVLFVLGRFWHRLTSTGGALRFGVDDQRLARLEDHFRLHGGRTLLFGKLTHSAGFLILLAAGASGMSLLRFIYYNFLGTIPKSLFFIFIGYTFGYAYSGVRFLYIPRIGYCICRSGVGRRILAGKQEQGSGMISPLSRAWLLWQAFRASFPPTTKGRE